jgi:hypothetical protein
VEERRTTSRRTPTRPTTMRLQGDMEERKRTRVNPRRRRGGLRRLMRRLELRSRVRSEGNLQQLSQSEEQ